jgi:hypothetical protein
VIWKAVFDVLSRIITAVLPLVLAYRKGQATVREDAKDKALEFHREANRIDADPMSVNNALDELRKRTRH